MCFYFSWNVEKNRRVFEFVFRRMSLVAATFQKIILGTRRAAVWEQDFWLLLVSKVTRHKGEKEFRLELPRFPSPREWRWWLDLRDYAKTILVFTGMTGIRNHSVVLVAYGCSHNLLLVDSLRKKYSTPINAKGSNEAKSKTGVTVDGQFLTLLIASTRKQYRIKRTPCVIPIEKTYSRLMNPNVTLKMARREIPSKTLSILNILSTVLPY